MSRGIFYAFGSRVRQECSSITGSFFFPLMVNGEFLFFLPSKKKKEKSEN